jgi:hypothetical protein
VSAPALWLVAYLVPPPTAASPQLPLVYFGLGGLIAASAVLGLARLSAPRFERFSHDGDA